MFILICIRKCFNLKVRLQSIIMDYYCNFRVATNSMYPWQSESNIHLPGGAISVAHQFLRCVLHQLAPNGIFTQMFQTNAPEKVRVKFFKSVIQSLIDFNELNPVAPLHLLLEVRQKMLYRLKNYPNISFQTLNSKKILPIDILPTVLDNMACYMNCLPLEAALGPNTPMWSTVLQQLEIFFRKIILLLNILDYISPLLNIMASVFKTPLISQFKVCQKVFIKYYCKN